MQRLINIIDTATAWVGRAFAWCILVMALGIGYEVYMRRAHQDPTAWAFDLSYMMFGALFMMAGAYTLSRNGHVRADVIYRLLKPKTQAIIEFTLYIAFFYPVVIALIFAGFDYALDSWSYNSGRGEVSVMSPANVPIFQFKTIIPVAGSLFFIQGIAQLCRCIICIKTGQWPPSYRDVEEKESQQPQMKENRSISSDGVQ